MSPEEASNDDPEWVGTWKEHASAFDRVKSVTMTLSELRSAPWIAEESGDGIATIPTGGIPRLQPWEDVKP